MSRLLESTGSVPRRKRVACILALVGAHLYACGPNSITFRKPGVDPPPTTTTTSTTSIGSGGTLLTGPGSGGGSGSPGTGGSGGAGGAKDGGGGAKDGGDPMDSSSVCNRDCPSAPCTRLEKAWRTLAVAEPGKSITSLAVGSDTLYFGTVSSSSLVNGEIVQVPLVGGDAGGPTVFVSNVQATGLFLQGGFLYYVDNVSRGEISALRVVPTIGGQHETIASDSRLSDVRVDGDFIYYSTSEPFGTGRIMRVGGRGMSTPEVVVETKTPWGFTIDGGSIYWAQYDNGGALLRRELAGGPTSTLATSAEAIVRPVVKGDSVYFFYGATPSVCKGAVLRVPRTGGPVEQLSPGNTAAASAFGGLAFDASYVYWAQVWDVDGWLVRAPIGGGNPDLVLTQQILSGGVTADATSLYWVARSKLSSPYEVRALER